MVPRRLEEIRKRIARAAERSGRPASAVTLVAVAKSQPWEKILEAVEAGQYDLGENYAQELLEHERGFQIPGSKFQVCFHFIGHLQRNKVKSVLPYVSLIHSLDSMDLAREIDKRAEALGRVVPVLIEVNLGGEVSKSGVSEDDAKRLAAGMTDLTHVDLIGLMTLPPLEDDPEKARPFFRRLREIREDISRQNLYKHPLTELSMGMTHDFETAVEEGATFVRVGTGIFGERET